MADTKKYYWLKLKEDFFGDKEIKKLRRIAGGDTYTIIYLKLMLLGLRDEGRLFFEGIEDSFAEELALELDEDAENVKITMMYLARMGMLEEVSESELFLTRLPECVGKETAKAELMRRKRARDAVSSGGNGNNVTTQLPPVTEELPPVTKCYTEKEIRERDRARDREKRVDYQLVADMYNEICISFPRLRSLSDARKKAIRARIHGGYTMDDFRALFTAAEASSFLKGKNNRNWSASFDWLIKDGNMAKVIEGNYADKSAAQQNEERDLLMAFMNGDDE